MQTDLSKTASDIKTKASTAYSEVTKFGDEVLLNQDSFLKLGGDVQNILNDLGVQGRLMTQMPILAGEVKYLKKIIDNIGKGKFEFKSIVEKANEIRREGEEIFLNHKLIEGLIKILKVKVVNYITN